MSNMKTAINEAIITKLDEAAKLTNGEANKIGKAAEKEAAKVRKAGGPLADNDATYLENFAKDAFSRSVKRISRTMNGGETDNREEVFKVVSSVIGKERAADLAKGEY